MEKLPNEVLINIFKQLPQKDLLTLSTVCNLYCEIIKEYNLLKHLVISKFNDESCNPPANKFTKATIKKGYETNVHQKAFEIYGNGLTSLEFSHCSVSLNTVSTILSLSPSIKELKFDYVRWDEDPTTKEPPVLSDLTLIFLESHPGILSVLQRSSILKIEIRLYGDSSYTDFEDLAELLKTQDTLTSFSVSGAYETSIFLIPMNNKRYHLKEFSIDNCDIEELENIDIYLADHVNSLEKLMVKDVRWDPSDFINRCTNLKTFIHHRSNNHFEFDNEIGLTSLQDVPSLRNLSLSPPILAMNKFANVKKLFISSASNAIFRNISNSMKALEDVEVEYGGLDGFNVPTIKKLKLISLDTAIDPNFFVIHKFIEELVFKNVYNITNELLLAITTNLKNLRVLKIFGVNHLTVAAFTMIKENCKQLKIFEMSKWNQSFSRADWKCLYDISGLMIYTETFWESETFMKLTNLL